MKLQNQSVETKIAVFTAVAVIFIVASAVLLFWDIGAIIAETAVAKRKERPLNSRLVNLPPNQWVKIRADQKLGWHRQGHAGIAFDSRRGTILIFGSDTHNTNWDNAVHEFDPVTERWSTHYAAAPKQTYRADPSGWPVSGDREPLPWAMHTFDNIVYDPQQDALVVTALPAHNPIKKTVMGVKAHPTWVYRLSDHHWEILDERSGQPSPTFFAAASAYDAARDVIVAYKNGVWELGLERRVWQQATQERHHQIHFNMAYDSRHNVLAVFGDFGDTSDVWIYMPGSSAGEKGSWEKRVPGGDVCPRDQHFPVAFDHDNGVFLILPDNAAVIKKADGKSKRAKPTSSSTFVYDFETDTYRKLPNADMPSQKMNYMMVYDPFHRVFLLVTGNWKNPLTVWALKLDLGSIN